MSPPLRALIAALLFTASSTQACLWDNDTLKDEQRGLPAIADVLAGKFERHSRYFYEQRIVYMKAAIEKNPNDLAAYDNLAVAYEKLDDQDSAIAIMLQKEKIKPAQYTTYANLGTFYLHKGDFENGIAYIKTALAINPEAHFGREEYQLKLAEFLHRRKTDPSSVTSKDFLDLNLDPEQGRYFPGRPDGLWENARTQFKLKPNVFDGIVGMLRFGTGRSPDLYYVLGGLLTLRGDKHLAYRAYKRAIELNHPLSGEIREGMERLKSAVEYPSDFDDAVIAKERADADAWVRAFQDYEDNLVRSGKDPEATGAYDDFYRRHGHAAVAAAAPSRAAVLLARVINFARRHPVLCAFLVVTPLLLIPSQIRYARQKRAAARAALFK